VYDVNKTIYGGNKNLTLIYELVVEVTAIKTWNDQDVYEINYTQVVEGGKYLSRSDYITGDWILLRSIDYLFGPNNPEEWIFNPGLKLYDFPLYINKRWTFFTNMTRIRIFEGERYVSGPRIMELNGEVLSEVETNVKAGHFKCLKINITLFDHGPWVSEKGEICYEKRPGSIVPLEVDFFGCSWNIVYFSSDVKYYPKFEAYYKLDDTLLYFFSYELTRTREAMIPKPEPLWVREDIGLNTEASSIAVSLLGGGCFFAG